MSKIQSYQALAAAITELKTLANEGRWDEASSTMDSLAQGLPDLPSAADADRDAIEGALRSLVWLTERVRPLREDTARLLAAFDPSVNTDSDRIVKDRLDKIVQYEQVGDID